MINLTTDELIEELRDRLRRAEKVGDWVDAAHDGELLTSSQAAEVAGITAETIRIYAERAEAAGRPIGVQFAHVWIIFRARLLDFIARRDGKPARLMAEKRAEKRAVSRLDGFDADLVRVRYIRHLRANLVTHATAGLTEERSKLVRAQRERLEFKTARDAARYVSVEEVDRQFATVKTRLEDIPAGYANGIAEAARRADGINEANAAVGVRLRSAITEALGILVAINADKTRKAAA